MPYHQGLTRAQGDPGFFSFLGKVAKTVGGIIPGPIGGALGIVGGALSGRKATKKPPPPTPIVQAFPGQMVTGLQGRRIRAAQGRAIMAPPPPITTIATPRYGASITARATPAKILPTGQVVACPRRRRIDPLNVKALRRANTRQRAFLRAVDRTLKTMPTKGSVASRRKKIAGATRRK